VAVAVWFAAVAAIAGAVVSGTVLSRPPHPPTRAPACPAVPGERIRR
jgi:hypothetical protein